MVTKVILQEWPYWEIHKTAIFTYEYKMNTEEIIDQVNQHIYVVDLTFESKEDELEFSLNYL